ncbi:MAG TPA: flagellar hook-associated protein FlgL [Stellaceae bacterium]|nr:flagellar hook-associated protein FlgL [Stellaceae bacterium]
MRISTNEFLLGSLNDMLGLQSNINTLNQEIATGQSLVDPTTDPAGAGLALNVAGQLGQLTYDSSNAQSGTLSIQNGLGVLQQVTTLINQIRQTAEQAANGTMTAQTRSSLVTTVQGALQELVQLANSQTADGSYLFAGSKANSQPFQLLSNGQVQYSGDGASNQIEIAPSLKVPVTISGQSIFMNIPDGNGSFSVAASGSNTGEAVAVPAGVTSASQIAAESQAGTQFEIAFSAGSGLGSLTYTVTSGTGSPGSAGFAASEGVVASGSYATGSDILFGGMDVRLQGTPAAGDAFTVQASQNTSLFATLQSLVSALQLPGQGSVTSPLAQQQIQNVLGGLDQAQTSILLAQATLGANLSEIQSVQGQDSTQSSNAQVQLSQLQSANLPQVTANYSESVTALQAAETAFGRIQNLTLFSVIHA